MSNYSVTFCTVCKTNVNMTDLKFIRLANNMVTIRGYCNICGVELIKGKVMPKSGKNTLAKYKRKLNRKRLNIYKSGI